MGKLKVAHGVYPAHTRVDDELKSYGWCLSNGIKIGPIPLWDKDYGKWTVEITMSGKRHVDPHRYLRETVMQKVYEYCDYYYNKYKKDGE
tara:strand:+ start:106 stop:375 length:270 start_codon:yes stop_codon:yes gene_type:complete